MSGRLTRSTTRVEERSAGCGAVRARSTLPSGADTWSQSSLRRGRTRILNDLRIAARGIR
jgi:hypothetical protein